MSDDHAEILRALYYDRPLAHRTLFKSKGRNDEAPFHCDLIADLHSEDQFVSDIAFRGSAKSTKAEEAMVIRAGFREFRYGLIIGNTLDLARQRLRSIKLKLVKNARIRQLFGDLKGPVWADDEIVLSNDLMIKAMGRGQAIRGTKEEESRPDFILCDDLEDYADVRTPELRAQTSRWFFAELLPAADPKARVRMLSNVVDAESLSMTIAANPDSGFVTHSFPIEHLGELGERTPSWPDRFPLSMIDTIKARYESQGRLREYMMEYMCEATSEHDRAFTADMIRVYPRAHQWEARQGFFDPARTTARTSANTGFADWSWVGRKLVVWDAWGELLMPSEIIDRLFDYDRAAQPIDIGIERDGLEEWLMQPIRLEQTKRGILIPVRPMKAPVGKLDFIRSLQIYFQAREIEFAKELPDLKRELVSFPGGKKDIANALAYALKMRPGLPVYEDFTSDNVIEHLKVDRLKTCWVALNATSTLVSAALVQMDQGRFSVLADWIREGEPAAILPDLLRDVRLAAGQKITLMAGPRHFERFNNVGLVQACRRLQMGCERGGGTERGREELRRLLRARVRLLPALAVSHEARNTLRALGGGYSFQAEKTGSLAPQPQEGPFRVLMEGIEALAGAGAQISPEDDNSGINWQTTQDGRRFISARINRG